jgi:hypothetical protein
MIDSAFELYSKASNQQREIPNAPHTPTAAKQVFHQAIYPTSND